MSCRIVLVNGSPRAHGGTSAALEQLQAGMEQAGAQVSAFRLNDLDFRGCQGCMGCKRAPGCVVRDGLTPVLDELATADALVIGSPIYMFAVSGQTALFTNRMYSLIDASYRPYAHRTRSAMTVYSMGSPSESYAAAEAGRMRRALDMLGFREVDRVAVTGVFPGCGDFSLSPADAADLRERGCRFVREM